METEQFLDNKAETTSFVSEDSDMEISKEVPVNDSRELHEPQLSPRNLEYQYLEDISGEPIFTSYAVEFPLNPNTKYLKGLEKIKETDSPVARYTKLILMAGTDKALLDLIVNGISTGLSHGTMDVIYRVGVGEKVGDVLDNFDIAIGSLQRRVIVSDIIAKKIKETDSSSIMSIAGGSCLLPIEGIYQSGKEGMVITNVDRSEKANEKAEKTLKNINNKKNLGLSLRSVSRDILQNGLEVLPKEEPEIIECTGFWEYLDNIQREALLKNIAEGIQPKDSFILTVLINNPQQYIFDAVRFKKLSSTKLEDLIPFVKKYFRKIEKVIKTPNNTYATLVVRK
ncbi:MAG TPA: hypothetical protein PLE51_03815 [Candidatus Pacearchaeota archaeon]|nr:hypothetical protein [Candidatus Pacearchaeota archaeon]